MLSFKKEADLRAEVKYLRKFMEDGLYYTLSDSFHHILSDELELKTLSYCKQGLGKSEGDGIVINLIRRGAVIYADIYSTSPFTDSISLQSAKDKLEIKVSKFFLHGDYAPNHEFTLQNKEQARQFFMDMDCSHEKMQKMPERYQEYQHLSISQEMEDTWIQWYERNKKIAQAKEKATQIFDKLLNRDLEIPSYLRRDQSKEAESANAASREASLADNKEPSAGNSPQPSGPASEATSPEAAGTSFPENVPATEVSPESLNRFLYRGTPEKTPITNLSQARKFYIAMKGSYARMRQEHPERYEEYKRVGVTKAHEDKWRKKLK